MGFTKAVKTKAKLRVALAGVSGAGKTYSALMMAKALGGRVALIDSERSSALLYADKFEFDHMDLSDHGIDRYKAAIREAAAYDAGVKAEASRAAADQQDRYLPAVSQQLGARGERATGGKFLIAHLAATT